MIKFIPHKTKFFLANPSMLFHIHYYSLKCKKLLPYKIYIEKIHRAKSICLFTFINAKFNLLFTKENLIESDKMTYNCMIPLKLSNLN